MDKNRNRIETLDDAVKVLSKVGTREGTTVYLERPVGIHYLGVVDYINKHGGLVVFSHSPKKEKSSIAMSGKLLSALKKMVTS